MGMQNDGEQKRQPGLWQIMRPDASKQVPQTKPVRSYRRWLDLLRRHRDGEW